MRKIAAFVIVLICILLPACGEGTGQEGAWRGIAPGMEDLSAITDRTEYFDLAVESELLFGQGTDSQDGSGNAGVAGDAGYRHLGTQFYMGEPVQLRAAVSLDVADIYLYRKDGSKELVLKGIPARLARPAPRCRWYLDREGDFYCICMSTYVSEGTTPGGGRRVDASIVKILSSGEILYETALPEDIDIDDICQTEDGRVYVQLRDEIDGGILLTEINPATGGLQIDSQMEVGYDSHVYLGSAGDFLAVTGYGKNYSREIMKVDLADASLEPILYFTGTSYGWHSKYDMRGFQVLEDGSVELLWTDSDGLEGFLERLRMEKVEEIPIVCRGEFGSWFEERASWFNQKNSEYHVVLEDCGVGNDAEDFARLTSVQIGAGKGPDIVCGDLLQDYIVGMVEKGALEDLNPYLAASGMREEDYFPSTFATWRQGEQIIGISYWTPIRYYVMDADILGKQEVPDIETLVDALLSRDGDGVWLAGLGPAQVLNWFLEGTESFWGMVDWGNGQKGSGYSCDFNTPLFRKLLEAAKRYGDDGRKNLEASICEEIPIWNLFFFKGQAELEASGKVVCGILFDDGAYAVSDSSNVMAINANSSHKEGAWEFISFLIGEEIQAAEPDSLSQPVHKKVFEDWLQEKIIYELTTERKVNGAPYRPAYYGEDTSEEKLAEYRQIIEDARPLPLRNGPILAIILDEAEDYFNGSKSAEEVIGVINNRVQVYLGERE